MSNPESIPAAVYIDGLPTPPNPVPLTDFNFIYKPSFSTEYATVLGDAFLVPNTTSPVAPSAIQDFFFKDFIITKRSSITDEKSFFEEFKKYMENVVPANPYVYSGKSPYDGFLFYFKQTFGDLENIAPLGAHYNPPDDGIGDDLFKPSFSSFIKQYIDGLPPIIIDPPEDFWKSFISQYGNYLAMVGVLTNANISTVRTDGSKPYIDLISYEKIYQAFLGINSADFQQTLLNFYQGKYNAADFKPTQEMLLWFSHIQQRYLLSPESSRVISSPTDAEKTLILNDIFELIVSMIDAIERVTEAQADRLTFLTSYQKAYTDLMAQVPVYVKSETNTGVIYIEDKDNTTERNDLNQLSQGYLDNLRNYRDLVSDDSKTIQSAINQSNDEVSGVTDLANHIMDTLSSLLQAIYR